MKAALAVPSTRPSVCAKPSRRSAPGHTSVPPLVFLRRAQPEQAPTPEAKHLAEQAQLQADRNRAYYAKNRALHRSVVLRLTEQIRNCILVHQQPNARIARSGALDPERVWRAPLLNDSRVFRCAEEENQPSFTVDLLLDASASRLHCQEVIAAQGTILAQSLAACGIPVRVSSFCSLRGYTVLRVLKGFADKSLQGIDQYFASGWNRDGLALRAAGDLVSFDPGPAPRHLLILLTDASPNDSRRVPPSPEQPLGCDYGGSYGVDDAAAEVRTCGARVCASLPCSWARTAPATMQNASTAKISPASGAWISLHAPLGGSSRMRSGSWAIESCHHKRLLRWEKPFPFTTNSFVRIPGFPKYFGFCQTYSCILLLHVL